MRKVKNYFETMLRASTYFKYKEKLHPVSQYWIEQILFYTVKKDKHNKQFINTYTQAITFLEEFDTLDVKYSQLVENLETVACNPEASAKEILNFLSTDAPLSHRTLFDIQNLTNKEGYYLWLKVVLNKNRFFLPLRKKTYTKD